jgi:hypothetical protein
MILDETDTLYDKLVKHFTNSIMDNVAGASSSSNSSLSSTLPRPLNQIDTCRKEDLQIYDNGRDIVD